MKKIEPHYRALVQACEKHGYPARFKTDLTEHDRAWLSKRDPSVPFLWCLRPTGTHIVAVDGSRDRCGRAIRRDERASAYVGMVESAFSGEPCRWFGWDGLALIEFQNAKCAEEWARNIETLAIFEKGA